MKIHKFFLLFLILYLTERLDIAIQEYFIQFYFTFFEIIKKLLITNCIKLLKS